MIRNYKHNKFATEVPHENEIRTLNVEKKVWEYLGRWQSQSYVEGQLQEAITDNANLISAKSNQITATITQSQKYFEVAKSAPLEISPLLLYYGMVGLAKCLILSGDNSYTLDYMEPRNKDHRHHGLQFGADTEPEKKIRDGNSLLEEFCTVWSNQNRIGLYNCFRQCYSATTLPNNFSIRVDRLLSYVPELHNDYYAQLKKEPRTWVCYSQFGSDSNDQSIQFSDHYFHYHRCEDQSQKDIILRCFPKLESDYTQDRDNKFVLKGKNVVSVDDCIYLGEVLTMQKFAFMEEQDYVFTDFDVQFLLMYILSNLVRYKQNKWANLILRRHNNDIFLIDSFIEVTRIKFPWLILRELDNYGYTFMGEVASLG